MVVPKPGAPLVCHAAIKVSGTATAIVLATGRDTFFGLLAEHAAREARPPTQFQSGINQVSVLLIRFMLVMVPLVVVSVPVLSLAENAVWPESGVMSRSAKLIAAALEERRTPVPPDPVTVVLAKVMLFPEARELMKMPSVPGFVMVVTPVTVVAPPAPQGPAAADRRALPGRGAGGQAVRPRRREQRRRGTRRRAFHARAA